MKDPWTPFEAQDANVDPDAMSQEMRRIAGALVPELDELAQTIWEDMDASVHGIGWWQAHLPDRPRILIADHLVQSITSIGDNLLDAALHKIQALAALDAESARLARLIKVDGTVKFPPPTSPRDMLNDKLIRLNTAGFFRSLGSTLDCLAAAIIGVLGLPDNIVRADFKGLKQALALRTAHKLWADFERDLARILSSGGPRNWDVWVSDYRNMLIHRARRLEFSTIKASAHILDSAARPVPRTDIVSHLVRDPALSDIEAMAKQIGGPPPNLEENGRNTMEATFAAAREAVVGTAKLLRAAWAVRRATPAEIPQPASQWPTAVKNREADFDGFEPGSEPFQANAMFGDPTAGDRIRFSALDDAHNAIWRGYF